MIRFCCEHCAYKISVQDNDVGKQGKCPKCGGVIVVPAESTVIDFHCENCGRGISVPKIDAGKKAICPQCSNTFIIPAIQSPGSAATQNYSGDLIARSTDSALDPTLLDVPEQYNLKEEPAGGSNVSEEDSKAEETESADRRKLPWILDIFLYPISGGTLSTIGIILILKLIADFATSGMLICCVCLGGTLGLAMGAILGLVLRIISYSYLYWYFTECIRDSALGGLRAPVVIADMPGLGDMIWHLIRIFSCYAFTLGPVTFYRGYTYFLGIEGNNVILLVLLTYGMFFFPMGILAVVMFDSVNGLKPTLLIRSIASTFFHYCGLVILFYGLGILFGVLYGRIVLILIKSGLFSWNFLVYIIFNMFLIYSLLISGHLLGRFFYRYEDKLYWEV